MSEENAPERAAADEVHLAAPSYDRISDAPPAHAPEAPAAETKAVEAWAEAKGDIKPGWDPDNRYVSVRFAHFAPQHFNVAKFLRGWGIGHAVTEAEYDAALHDAAHVTAG